jgi:hypothetical protein
MGNSILSDGRSNNNNNVGGGGVGRRRGSLSNMGGNDAFEISTTLSRHASSSKVPLTTDNAQSSDNLAMHLIQSTRGPNAKFSRDALQQQQQHSTDVSRQWQQALQSLFQNFCKELYTFRQQRQQQQQQGSELSNLVEERRCEMILDTYFYCLGQDHVVLFRMSKDTQTEMVVPAVLVTRASKDFQEKLEQMGVESLQTIDTIEEQEAKENSFLLSNRNTAISNSQDKALLSPSTKADLEFLRKKQAMGESAGADILVKIKKPNQNMQKTTNNPSFRGFKIQGLDNVLLFFEAYLNVYGDVTSSSSSSSTTTESRKRLPTLICHGSFGPFLHASMKTSRILPVPAEWEEEDRRKTFRTETDIKPSNNTFEVVADVFLPSTVRKLLAASRNLLLIDEAKNPIEGHRVMTSAQQDSSRYVVLHAERITSNKHTTHSTSIRTKESLVLNRGQKKDGNEMVSECPNGKIVSMIVWDSMYKEKTVHKLERNSSWHRY